MSPTAVKVEVNLVEKSVTFLANMLLQLGYRVEAGRVQGGYMAYNHVVIERGFRTWLAEEKLLQVHFEMFLPDSDEAYEKCLVELEYSADFREEATRPPIEELETVFRRLKKLPAGTKFRVVATTAPGASKVEGWYPTKLRQLKGGVKEEVEIGQGGFGFGHIQGNNPRYLISNWDEDAEDPPGERKQ